MKQSTLDLPEHRERQPEEEDELECKVEREPVDDVDEAFDKARAQNG